jgi:hypothetical protein
MSEAFRTDVRNQLTVQITSLPGARNSSKSTVRRDVYVWRGVGLVCACVLRDLCALRDVCARGMCVLVVGVRRDVHRVPWCMHLCCPGTVAWI